MTASPSEVRAAYAQCRRLARRHYENFPVASYLVPPAQRDALAAIYAFARGADDLADEPGVDGRLAALTLWREELREALVGERLHGAHRFTPSGAGLAAAGPQGTSPVNHRAIWVALADAVQKFQLSPRYFEDLLRAFELDGSVNRHSSFSSLLAYCSCSANPVGRLVLELFGHREPKLVELSDCICTALQLTNFWQDAAVDFARDRVYVPLEDFKRFDYSLDDLGAGRADDRWQRLMAFEAGRTRELFERGKPLTEKVAPGLRRQLRLTWLGGMEILTKLEAARYDVFRRRPKLGRRDFLRLYLKARRALN